MQQDGRGFTVTRRVRQVITARAAGTCVPALTEPTATAPLELVCVLQGT